MNTVEEESTCKKCGTTGARSLFFNKKKKQVTCNSCLEKSKSARMITNNDKIRRLESRVIELEELLEKERKVSAHYQDLFSTFSGKYTDLCLSMKTINLD
jgi:DNA-binding transcriptional regulator GbsR (MarR family)